MAKKSKKSRVPEVVQDYVVRRESEPLEAKNPHQRELIRSISDNFLTFAIGPAGTGKTFCATAMAAQALQGKRVEKIVVTRPMREAAGENMGFLPGTVEEKFAPYFTPIKEVLEERLGRGFVEYLVKAHRIEIAPLALMRGRSFKDCFVLLDEAQNMTEAQMKLFLTRLGERARVVVNGDLKQKDLGSLRGLEDAINRVGRLRRVGVVEFDQRDIVRSPLVQQIVEAYE